MSNQPGFTAGESLEGRPGRHRTRTLYRPPVPPGNLALSASWMPAYAAFEAVAPAQSPAELPDAVPGMEATELGEEADPGAIGIEDPIVGVAGDDAGAMLEDEEAPLEVEDPIEGEAAAIGEEESIDEDDLPAGEAEVEEEEVEEAAE